MSGERSGYALFRRFTLPGNRLPALARTGSIRENFVVTPFPRPSARRRLAGADDGIGQRAGMIGEVHEVDGGEGDLNVTVRGIGEGDQHGGLAFGIEECAHLDIAARDAGKVRHSNPPSVGVAAPTVAEAGESGSSLPGGGGV